MQTWEYKIVQHWMDEAEMNSLGAHGWELVAASVDNSFYVFKRPKS